MSNQQIQPTDKIELEVSLVEKLLNVVGNLPASQVGELFTIFKDQVKKGAEKIIASKTSENERTE